MIAELLRYRAYIWRNSLVELRHRYAGAGLGFMWFLVFPIAQILIYSLVFSTIMEARVPELADLPMSFTLYLCSGLLPWLGFAEILSSSTSSLLQNAQTITRTSLPEQVFFAQGALAGLLTTCLSMLVLLIAAVGMGLDPSSTWLAVPVILVLLMTFGFGLGTFLGVLNVFSRDVSSVVSIALQVAMWSAPIVYVESILPESIRSLLVLNPVYPFITALHDTILFGRMPDASSWASMLLVSLAATTLGLGLLQRLRTEVRDAL